MNDNIVYKVGPKCSGKTAWLCDRADEELKAGNEVIYYASKNRAIHIQSFLEKFYAAKGYLCPLTPIVGYEAICSEDLSNKVILIDNLLQHENCANIDKLLQHSITPTTKVYITLNGICE